MNFTDEQADKIEAAFAELGMSLTVDDLTITQDTLADLKEASVYYKQPGRTVLDGAGVLVLHKVQVRKGSPCTDLFAIDFGDFRAVYL